MSAGQDLRVLGAACAELDKTCEGRTAESWAQPAQAALAHSSPQADTEITQCPLHRPNLCAARPKGDGFSSKEEI